jgi:hypothetical protein
VERGGNLIHFGPDNFHPIMPTSGFDPEPAAAFLFLRESGPSICNLKHRLDSIFNNGSPIHFVAG